jgi:hypothetical protein
MKAHYLTNTPSPLMPKKTMHKPCSKIYYCESHPDSNTNAPTHIKPTPPTTNLDFPTPYQLTQPNQTKTHQNEKKPIKDEIYPHPINTLTDQKILKTINTSQFQKKNIK